MEEALQGGPTLFTAARGSLAAREGTATRGREASGAAPAVRTQISRQVYCSGCTMCGIPNGVPRGVYVEHC